MAEIHVHPDLLKVVEAVVERVIGGLDVLNLKKCHEQLAAVDTRARNAEQIAITWQAIAKLQGEKIDRLEATVEQLQERDTRMHAEIALLRSALDNMSEAQEATAGDDGSSS